MNFIDIFKLISADFKTNYICVASGVHEIFCFKLQANKCSWGKKSDDYTFYDSAISKIFINRKNIKYAGKF